MVAHLIEQLHLAYNGKPAKGYATFSDDLQDRMALPLAQWQAPGTQLLQLAQQATSQLGGTTGAASNSGNRLF